jgi:hypothetical protein
MEGGVGVPRGVPTPDRSVPPAHLGDGSRSKRVASGVGAARGTAMPTSNFGTWIEWLQTGRDRQLWWDPRIDLVACASEQRARAGVGSPVASPRRIGLRGLAYRVAEHHRADARGVEHKPVYCYTSGLGRFRLDWPALKKHSI